MPKTEKSIRELFEAIRDKAHDLATGATTGGVSRMGAAAVIRKLADEGVAKAAKWEHENKPVKHKKPDSASGESTPKMSAKAAKTLRDPAASPREKSLAGSVLTQAPNKGK